MSKPLEIEGMKFGRLTAIRYSHTKNNLRYWECICGGTTWLENQKMERWMKRLEEKEEK